MNENIFKSLFDNIASRTVLALLGLIGTGVTVYAFLQEKNVDLRYEIVANTNVLDFNADISKLEVLYDSTNLKQTHENLRIYTVKVINNGDQNLTMEYYDVNEPLGIQISSGKIIEKPQLIQTSNDYIKRNLKITDYKLDKINFSQVILESGEFFIVKLLVLHKKEATPKIISFGKIAGQKYINVVNSIDVKDDLTFWDKVFQGNIWVQLLRLLSYFLAGVLLIGLIIISSDRIDSYRGSRRRIKIVKEFKALKTYQYTRMDDAIFDRYQKSEYNYLSEMRELIKDEELLNQTFKNVTDHLKSKEQPKYNRNQEGEITRFFESDHFAIINEMLNDGIVFREHDRLVINQLMKDTLEKFAEFLNTKGITTRKYFNSRTDILLEQEGN